MTYKNYTHISYKERVLIEQFKEKDNLSIAEIARKLNRNKSTILRELRRGATKYVRKFSLIVTRVQLLVWFSMTQTFWFIGYIFLINT